MPQRFWDRLEEGGKRVALLCGDSSCSYEDLAKQADDFVADLRQQLPSDLSRPLVCLEMAAEVSPIAAYLGCLRAGWPVLLLAQGAADEGIQALVTFRPNVVVRRASTIWKAELSDTEPVDMHPDLAVLLSTSGTTGSAKLVRLSAANLEANAQAIVEYLGVRPTDRAITTLPFQYSYGMSVLHIHLVAHASLILTELSLIEDDFWALAKEKDVTSLALVPTQFELLEKRAFRRDHLPKLRYVTQAGGRLDPTLGKAFAAQAASEGWSLFIMYGQTEAAPRISFVPPEDVQDCLESIGRPIPGGRLHLIDQHGKEILSTGVKGELVYEGPNVMLGYALTRDDLNAPAGPARLKTGDIAERQENGYFRITGRSSRFVKLFGLRVSLDEVEVALRAEGLRAYASGNDQLLVVFIVGEADPGKWRREIASRYKLPESSIRVDLLEEVPLLSSGKIDYRELGRRAASEPSTPAELPFDISTLLRSALRTPALNADKSFLELGGDSLAYLEVQLYLSTRMGSVPIGWEHLKVKELVELERATQAPKMGWQKVSADLIGRVAAILAVIALHSTNWSTGGGSVLLLIFVGYSLARFQSMTLFSGRVYHTLKTMLGPILTIYYFLLVLAAIRFREIDWGWFFLIENFAEHPQPAFMLPYWFVSAYAQIIVLASLPFWVTPLRKRIRSVPFESALILLALVGLLIQFTPIHSIPYSLRHRHTAVAMELLLSGWCIFFSTTPQKKFLTAAALVAVWWQNYGLAEWSLSIIMLGGAFSTLFNLRVLLPLPVAQGLLRFGSLSMFIYLAHVPVLYKARPFIHSDLLMFLTVVAVSTLVALGMKKTTDFVSEHVDLWFQKLTKVSPAR